MSKPLSPLGEWLFGAVFWIVGGLIMALALGWIPSRPENFHSPRWVLGVAGGVFFLGGFAPLISRLGPDSVISRNFLLLFVGAFASIFNWIAFGPGPRRFSGGMSIGPFSSVARASEMSGRIAFGISAVFIDLVLLSLLWKAMRPSPPDKDR